MMNGTTATGRWWPQPAAQFIQTHEIDRRRSERVGTGGRGAGAMLASMTQPTRFASAIGWCNSCAIMPRKIGKNRVTHTLEVDGACY